MACDVFFFFFLAPTEQEWSKSSHLTKADVELAGKQFGAVKRTGEVPFRIVPSRKSENGLMKKTQNLS